MKLLQFSIIILLALLLPDHGSAAELKTRVTSLLYQDTELLQQFNQRVRLGLSNSLGRARRQLSLEEEVGNKVDLIYGRVQEILDMRPAMARPTIVLLPSPAEVQLKYWTQYARQVDYVAFFSPQRNRIYLAVDSANVRVLAHEMAHVVIHHFFQRRPPEKVHEVLAQHVEKQFRPAKPTALK